MQSRIEYYRIDRRKVFYLKFVLEGYDGLALLRTVDSGTGIVALHIAPGCDADVAELIMALRQDMRIEPITLALRKNG